VWFLIPVGCNFVLIGLNYFLGFGIVLAMNRRDFLKKGTCLSGTLMFGAGGTMVCGQGKERKETQHTKSDKSLLVSATRGDLRTPAGRVSSEKVQKLLDTAMENFYKVSSPHKAWQQVVGPEDIVGIKVNCLAGKGISTSIELVEAIQERLLEVGIPQHRIIVWDRLNSDLERAGYGIYYGKQKPQCYGNDQIGYSNDIFEYGSVGSRLSKIILHQCTAVINVPILKDHGIVGVTMALKNFFGAIDNPNKYHDSVGDPYIADVNMIPEIRNKVRLTICDAITAQYEGGPPYMPQWTWQHNGLLVGKDMVALDHIGWQMIEDKRKKVGMEPLAALGREPTYIATAAEPARGLGTNDTEKIQMLRV